MMKYSLLLLGLCSLVLAARFYIDYDGLKDKWAQENFWLKKANTQDKFSLIVLGDSRSYYGVNPSVLGKSSLSFSFSSISFTQHYLEAAEKITQDQATILIGLTAEALTGFQEDEGLTSYEKSGPLIFHQTLKWIRLYWPQIELQKLFKWGQLPLFQHRPQKGFDIFHPDGWVESRKTTQDDFGPMIRHYRELSQNYKISDSLIQGLSQKVGLWVKQGKKVSFFWLCFETQVCEAETPLLPLKRKAAISADLISNGAKLLEISGRFKTFDGDHLMASDALIYSEKISKELNQNKP
jgi:hypothetical protein